MILRGFSIAHWRCIARLEVTDLPTGVIVLHGPNRTGKSSIVQAIRGCLFDYDHNSSKAELLECVPWNQAGPPRVAVEFETGGVCYRLTKVFSKRADGLALLEKRHNGEWQVLEDAPKEASRRVRELLNAESSSQGLNQLLWLDQGTTELPRPRDLDQKLERQLEAVLGIMVTGRDVGFKQALDKRCSRWFGENQRERHKPSSPVLALEKHRADQEREVERLRAELRQIEQEIVALDACKEQLPAAEGDVREAASEVERLYLEREATRQRRQLYQQALREHQLAEERLKGAQERTQQYQAAKERWQAAETQAARADADLQAVREDHERQAAELAHAQEQLEAARRAEEELQGHQADLEDRRKLLTWSQECQRWEELLERAQKIETQIAEHEASIGRLAGPDGRTLDTLQANRQHAAKLRAQLQAGVLTLTIKAQQPWTCTLSLDDAAPLTMTIPQGQEQTWSLRQRAGVEIPGLGRIELGRGRENQDLERQAQQLANLDQEYQETVQSAGEQPEDPSCLPRLTERRVAREAAQASMAAAKRALLQTLPHGRSVIEANRAKLLQQQESLLRRRPDLAAWQPTRESLLEVEQECTDQAAQRQRRRKEVERIVKSAASQLDITDRRLREVQERVIRERTTACAALEELQRLGDELSLAAQVRHTQEALEAAKAQAAAAQLTESELTVDERYQTAEAALDRRKDRLQQLKDEINRHRGRLESSQGLHTRLADAEAALHEIEIKLERERLEADAHRRLRELFDSSRDSQVKTVMWPIADRVMRWATRLGLHDYRQFQFGDKFLPHGLVLHTDHDDTTRDLAAESLGTIEQLSLLVRLALGGILARNEPATAILDDPLVHSDAGKHRLALDIIRMAAAGNAGWTPPAGPLQILIFTCHPERFDHVGGAKHIDLTNCIEREN